MTMSYDTWVETYRPIRNEIDTNASFDGLMFETFGAEHDFVAGIAQQDPNKVWTLREEDGVMAVTPGMGFVNRLGYFVTEVAAGDDVPDEILLDD